MSTPKTWDEATWPDPQQLSEWLLIAEPHEREDYCINSLRCLQAETARVERAMNGQVGTGLVTIEDVGPILEAIADNAYPGYSTFTPVSRMRAKSDLLSLILPGLEVFLIMVNESLKATRQSDATIWDEGYSAALDGAKHRADNPYES